MKPVLFTIFYHNRPCVPLKMPYKGKCVVCVLGVVIAPSYPKGTLNFPLSLSYDGFVQNSCFLVLLFYCPDLFLR